MRNLKEIARKAFEEEVIHCRSYSDERDANGLYVQEGLQAAWRNFCRGYESASEVTGAQGDGNSSSLAEILKGIDVCETDSDDGWWPTSTGAEFGARKLRELERFLADQAQDAEPVAYTNGRQMAFPINGWGMIWPEESILADVPLYTRASAIVPKAGNKRSAKCNHFWSSHSHSKGLECVSCGMEKPDDSDTTPPQEQ